MIVRHQKSTNNEYQRKSFSGQKKVPLCKPITICTTDRYVVDMLGPYPASQNNADIMKNIIEDPNGLCKFLRTNDVFVLDRGFCDVVKYLKEKNFKVLIPALKRERKQLLPEESKKSRFVNEVRWVIEALHGMLKQKYRLLDHKKNNKSVPNIGIYFRVASFLNNAYGQRLQSDKELSYEISQRMHAQKDVDNTLATEAEERGWIRRKTPFKTVTADEILDNLEMSERDLTIFFTGSYQVS